MMSDLPQGERTITAGLLLVAAAIALFAVLEAIFG
jgi:hypothetical protein